MFDLPAKTELYLYKTYNTLTLLINVSKIYILLPIYYIVSANIMNTNKSVVTMLRVKWLLLDIKIYRLNVKFSHFSSLNFE